MKKNVTGYSLLVTRYWLLVNRSALRALRSVPAEAELEERHAMGVT